MMTRAYDKFFLPGMMKNLGFAVDFAVNGCGLSCDSFYDFFIASKVAREIENGSPIFVGGCSGTELALSVFDRVGYEATTATDKSFDRFDRTEFHACLLRAFNLYKTCPDFWMARIKAGMEKDNSWAHAAKAYRELYLSLEEE